MVTGETLAAICGAMLAGPVWVSAGYVKGRLDRRWERRDEQRAANAVAERYSRPPRPVILPEPEVIDLTGAVQRRAADRHLNTPPGARHRAATRNGGVR